MKFRLRLFLNETEESNPKETFSQKCNDKNQQDWKAFTVTLMMLIKEVKHEIPHIINVGLKEILSIYFY